MARQLGYWKQRGIEVEIAGGRGSLGAIQGVSTGQFDMGGASTGANVLSIIKGVDLRIVGTQGYDASLGVLVPAKGPIKTAKDLEGKTIGVTAAGGDTPFLRPITSWPGSTAARSRPCRSTRRSSSRR